jgi:CO/xanthine dehydrogenase Mo-binding subunit
MNSNELIGGSPLRLDVLEKVKGTALYPDDLTMDGLLVGRVLRSPHPHARVRRMDLAAARALPGVVAVLTGDDITGPNLYGLVTSDQPALARTGGKVRYVGEAVAAVAAESPHAAEAALKLISVDYELLPMVTDPRLAAQSGAPLVHEDRLTNVLHTVRVRHGDVAAGLAAADVVVEGRYTTPFVEHAYLQPESGLARVDDTGRVTIWVGTQWPDEDRRMVSHALGLPLEQIRVITQTTGGAFGGREDISVQIVLALLALKTGRPVKMTYSRTESLVASTKRHPFDMVYRTGARRDGKLTAMEINLVANAGAYASTSAVVLDTAVTLATGPYEVPNVSVDSQAVYTNTPVAAAMRGFGANQPNFAVEMQMSKLAPALGMDPADVRRRNLYRPGSTMLTGRVLPEGVGAVKCLDEAMATASAHGLHQGQSRAEGAKRYGVGLACGYKNVGYSLGFDDKSGAVVEAYPDHAVVKVGSIDVGQGSTTLMAQLAASKLELPLSAIEVITNDTDEVPDAGSTSASRHTFVTGNAVLRAAAEAAQRLTQLGPHPAPGELPVIASVVYHSPTTYPLDSESGQSVRPNITYGYGCQVVEVEVDVNTGEVRVLQVVAAHDAGQAIHRANVEGQIEGGYMMGQGYALLEEHIVQDGVPKTTTLATFLIPTILDAPERIIPVVVEEPDPDGPYGAKGVGEMTMLPTPGAIAAAVHDAVGVWIDDLPLTPERILRALGKL